MVSVSQLPEKKPLAPENLFTLSDALQMELFVNDKGQVDGATEGRTCAAVTLGLAIPFNLRVMSNRTSYAGPRISEVALLCKGAGDLLVLAVHELAERKVHVFLVDREKLKAAHHRVLNDGLFEKDTRALFVVLDDLKCAIVMSYMRAEAEQKWKAGSDLLAVVE